MPAARERRSLPSGGPPAALGAMLAYRRRLGFEWNDRVFDRCVAGLVLNLDKHEAESWKEALLSQRDAWRSGYDRSRESTFSLGDILSD